MHPAPSHKEGPSIQLDQPRLISDSHRLSNPGGAGVLRSTALLHLTYVPAGRAGAAGTLHVPCSAELGPGCCMPEELMHPL